MRTMRPSSSSSSSDRPTRSSSSSTSDSVTRSNLQTRSEEEDEELGPIEGARTEVPARRSVVDHRLIPDGTDGAVGLDHLPALFAVVEGVIEPVALAEQARPTLEQSNLAARHGLPDPHHQRAPRAFAGGHTVMRPPRSRKSSTSRSTASRRASFEEGSLIIGIHLFALGTIAHQHTTTGVCEKQSFLSSFIRHLLLYLGLLYPHHPIRGSEEEDEDLEEDEEDHVYDDQLIFIQIGQTHSVNFRTRSLGQSSSMSLSSIWWTSTGSGVTSFAWANLASQSSIVPISAGAMSTPPECLWLISCFSR